MATNDSPDIVLGVIAEMQQDWAQVTALLGGTKTMRLAGELYLPRWPKEEPEAYLARLNLSTLLPAYSETVKNMTGRVFARPITLGDDVPEKIAEWCNDDVDLRGNNLDVFASEWFRAALAYGLAHCVIDFPRAGNARTAAEEKASGVRPYMVMVKPQQVLGFRYRFESGRPVLTQFRYFEQIEEEAGEFGTEVIQQIRVIEEDRYRIFRKRKASGWEPYEDGPNTLGKVPVVTYYTHQTGVMTAKPPLQELGYLNVAHWQSQSDQRNLLHIARVPILAAVNVGPSMGVDGIPKQFEMSVGSSSAVNLQGQGADLKFVEHGGQAMDAGRQSLEDLVTEMKMAGARLLSREDQAVKTAAQANEDAAEKTSALEAMGNNFEDAIAQALQLMADWIKAETGGLVTIEGSYDTDYAPEVSLPVLKAMCDAGVISQETLFEEVKRRGVISDSLVWEEERARIDEQRIRPDAQLLAQLSAAKTQGNISAQTLWGYISNGRIPDHDWSKEADQIDGAIAGGPIDE